MQLRLIRIGNVNTDVHFALSYSNFSFATNKQNCIIPCELYCNKRYSVLFLFTFQQNTSIILEHDTVIRKKTLFIFI